MYRIGGRRSLFLRIPPRNKQARSLSCHQSKIVNRQFRFGYRMEKQCLVMRDPPRNRRLVKQISIVVAIDLQTLVRFDDVEEQVKVHPSLRIRIYIRLQTTELGAGAEPLEIELHLH